MKMDKAEFDNKMDMIEDWEMNGTISSCQAEVERQGLIELAKQENKEKED